MLTGLLFVLSGIVVLVYPRILEIMFAAFLILFGLGMVATGWQFRRLRKHSDSRFINWIIRW